MVDVVFRTLSRAFRRILPVIAVSMMVLASCDLDDLFDGGSGTGIQGLSEQDLISGLKQALILGSKTAAFTLSDTTGTTNMLGEVTGYLANELVKILLPDDVEEAYANIALLNSTATGRSLLAFAGVDLSGYRDAMIRGLNRGAEAAAALSVDVFTTAVTEMTFTSAKEILFGADSTGATAYLETTTSDVLTRGFTPIIDTTFGLVKVNALGTEYTVKGVWSNFAENYNRVAGAYQTLVTTANSGDIFTSAAAQGSLALLRNSGISSIDPLNTDLVSYATGKALDGLFFMVGRQELKIRRDPMAALSAAGDFITDAIGDLIEKVFTSEES
jgi:hypothetical protein